LHCKLFAVGAKTIMKFIVAIEPGDADHSFGVVVPDLPGCFSAG
jgi:predicted RNase H-like HicB family nuclease